MNKGTVPSFFQARSWPWFVCRIMLLVALLALLRIETKAQILQPHRYEREQKNSDDYFHIISLKESGIALFRDRDKYRSNNRLWELILLDSTLREQHVLELEIKERHVMIGYEVTADRLYFLFRTGETTKNDFVLIEINLQGEEVARHTIKPDLDFRLTHFIKAGNNFVFGGYVSNEAVIVIFEPETDNLKVVPGFFQKDMELVDLRTNQNQTFNTVLINRNSKGQRKIVFRTFDESGKQLLEDAVTIDENVSLHTGITSALEREDMLIAGTWGEKNSKQSAGFYTITVNPFSEQQIRYIDFGTLDNFVDYLNEKRAQRIKETARESEANGKRSSFTSYVMPFRLAESQRGFYLLAEVYNPVGNTGMNNANPYYYNPFHSPYGYNPYWPGPGFYYPGMSRMYRPYMYGPSARTSDEVKSLETVLLAFDSDGKVKWDQSLKLEDIRIPGIEQVSDFLVKNDKVFLIYKKESEIKVKTIILDEGEDKIVESSEKLKLMDEHDVIRTEKERDNGVRHWYGNTFYVWGYQTIRNASREERVRDVFYINRVDAH